MRLVQSLSVALAALTLLGGTPSRAEARRPTPLSAQPAPVAQPLVSVSLETDGGMTLPTYWYGGEVYTEGQNGQRYNIRLTNNTGKRVEVVLTVDGRDVISGELGNYRKQRGYVLDPWNSVVVEGFRQSLAQVAAFRFSGLQDSYTARRGTPQHAGVIGVAVFKERRRARRRSKPVAVAPPPPPYVNAPAEPFPESGPRASAQSSRKRSRDAAMPSAAPSNAPAMEAEMATADQATAGASRDRSFAPAPVPRNELGTSYGESRTSQVQEVKFKRRRRRRPDVVFALHYDSQRGLAARGIPIHHPPAVGVPKPQPFGGPYRPR